jgi:hypothetical protein
MKAYISVALIVPVLAMCTACAEAPYVSEVSPAKAAPAPLPARRPAVALLDQGQTTGAAPAAVSVPGETPSQANDAAPATARAKPAASEVAPSGASSGGGTPAASGSTKRSIAADGAAAQPKAETYTQ